jgi:pimeloyl-ACP methyl ester carboxylesterase
MLLEHHTYTIFHKGKEVTADKVSVLLKEKKAMLAFHGFGQQAGVYKQVSVFYPECVFFSFDLFFHGKSNVSANENYDIDFFENEMRSFFKLFGIAKFQILAFSIGARLALALAARFPEMLVGLQLIAPDAIYENGWFAFATRNKMGKWFFALLSRNENILKRFLAKLIDYTQGKNNLLKLAGKVLEDHSLDKVYYTWLTYSNFAFEAATLLKSLSERNINIIIVLSTRDHVINANRITKILKECGDIFVIVSYKHEKLLAKLISHQYFENRLALSSI